MKGILYVITNNINGKQYVGKTYFPLKTRMKGHRKDATRYSNRPIYRAFNKYGVENFTIKKIDEFDQGRLEEKEIEYIAEYNTYKNGYNATLGGDGRRYFKHSDDEVINLYKKFQQVKLVAEKLSCDKHTISNILKSNNIYICSTHEQRAKPILLVEKNIKFKNRSDAAKYLINNNYTKNVVNSIISKIGRSANDSYKNKRSYGYHWENL